MNKKCIVQLIVGSAKETSVNGINTAVRLRNAELETRFDWSVLRHRIDGIPNLLRFIRKKPSCDYIFIDSFYCWEAILCAFILKHRIGAKIILWTHGAFNINHKEFHKLFYFHVVKMIKVDLLFVSGKSEMFYAERFNNNPVLVGNGIKVNEIEEIPRVSDSKQILYLGRFDYHGKGFDRMFHFISQHKDYVLHLHGKGDIPEVPLQIKDRVFFKKPLFGKAKDKLIMGASAVLLLSRREGMPMVGLESLILGTPVIASYETNLLDYDGVIDYENMVDLGSIDREDLARKSKQIFDIKTYLEGIMKSLQAIDD